VQVILEWFDRDAVGTQGADGADGGASAGQRGDERDAALDGRNPPAALLGGAAGVDGRIDEQVELAVADEVEQERGPLVLVLGDERGGDAVLGEGLLGLDGGEDLEAELVQLAGDRDDARLVRVGWKALSASTVSLSRQLCECRLHHSMESSAPLRCADRDGHLVVPVSPLLDSDAPEPRPEELLEHLLLRFVCQGNAQGFRELFLSELAVSAQEEDPGDRPSALHAHSRDPACGQ
jgi:hypothetical protein